MMNVKQHLTVLFWLYRQKAKADGKAPIYARITIDGKYTEISTGKKVNPASWGLDVKQVIGSGMEVKLANQKLDQLQTDVERIFNGIQTQFPEVTPASARAALSLLPSTIRRIFEVATFANTIFLSKGAIVIRIHQDCVSTFLSRK